MQSLIIFITLLDLSLKHHGVSGCLSVSDEVPFQPRNGMRRFNIIFSDQQLIISPGLSFSCEGRVTSWQAYLEQQGEIYTSIIFQVWRPIAGAECSYQLVGSHTVPNFTVSSNRLLDTSTLNLNLPTLEVQPGDVAAVYSHHASDNLNHNFQIYRSYVSTTYLAGVASSEILMKTSFSCNDADDTNSRVPLVTAVVEETTPPPMTMAPPPMTTPASVTTPLMETTPPSGPTINLPVETLPSASTTAKGIGGDTQLPVTSNYTLPSVSSKDSSQEEAEDDKVLIGITEYYIIAGVGAFLLLLVLGCSVCACACAFFLIRRRRAYKKSMHFWTEQNSRRGKKGKYYQHNGIDLQLPDNFNYNDARAYDTICEKPGSSRKKGNAGKHLTLSCSPQLLNTPESSMEVSKGGTINNRSRVVNNYHNAGGHPWPIAEENDYEEQPSRLSAFPVPNQPAEMPSNRVSPGGSNRHQELMVSDYEVPITRTIPGDGHQVPNRQSNLYEVPVAISLTANECDQPEDYEVPIATMKRNEEKKAGAAASSNGGRARKRGDSKGLPPSCKSSSSSGEYEVPQTFKSHRSYPQSKKLPQATAATSQAGENHYDTPCDGQLSQSKGRRRRPAQQGDDEMDTSSV